MSPFAWLGLPEDADEPAVKRAYAARLRTTRPDTDSDGFQRLHEVYRSALAMCRAAASQPMQAAAMELPAGHDPTTTIVASDLPTPEGMPARASAQMRHTDAIAFDLAAFSREAIMLAGQGDEEALQAWLSAQPSLWSFRTKAQANHVLMRALYGEEPPMPSPCLRALLRFFEQDHVRAGHDPLALLRLERRMHLAWLLMPAHRDELARRLQLGWGTLAVRGVAWRFSPPSTAKVRAGIERCLSRLQRPVRWWQGILAGLSLRAVGETGAFITQLAGARLDDFPSSFPRETLRFWSEAANSQRIGRARFWIGIGRALAASCLTLPLSALFALVESERGDQRSSFLSLLAFALLPWLVGLGWLAWRGMFELDRWHSSPEAIPAPQPRLRLAIVPALCAVGAIGAFVLPGAYAWLRYPPLFAGMWLALRRYWRRNGGAPIRVKPTVARTSLVVLMIVTASPGYVMGGAAMLAWAYDLWRHRDELLLDGRT